MIPLLGGRCQGRCSELETYTSVSSSHDVGCNKSLTICSWYVCQVRTRFSRSVLVFGQGPSHAASHCVGKPVIVAGNSRSISKLQIQVFANPRLYMITFILILIVNFTPTGPNLLSYILHTTPCSWDASDLTLAALRLCQPQPT
jgi:hypothetical protein